MKLDSQLFMPLESIIDPHWSRIDSLYIIHTGKVAQFRRTRRPRRRYPMNKGEEVTLLNKDYVPE